MMRALAQFVMRGRWQAATVALLGSWFPVISPATVGLVTLRCGVLDGCLVLLWAILPAIVALWFSDVGALMAYATMAVMLVVLVCAAFLRMSAAWPRTLALLVAVSALSGLTLAWLTEDVAASLTDALGELAVPAEPKAEGDLGAGATEGAESAVVETQPSATAPAEAPEVAEAATTGMIAYLVALSSLMALLVGRWWQALLYNPGGLQAEIHGLRLPPLVGLVSIGATAWCLANGIAYQSWANVFALPLLLAGVGLVHHIVKVYRLGLLTLVVFYAALVLVRLALLLVVLLAFADVWLNVRNRLKPSQS